MGDEDRLLNEALRLYANAEPLAGLEGRVLERVRADRARLRVGWWRWGLAAGLVAAAWMAVVWIRAAPESLSVHVIPPRAPQITMVAVEAPAPVRVTALPKRRVFPTPAVLTSEERALLAFVAQSPDTARDLQRPIDEPVRIQAIEIAPLESAELR